MKIDITVKSLPIEHKGRPLLLGQVLDTAIQDYIKALCTVGGVANTSIVMAAAEGIVASRDQSLLIQYGGHIQITKTWAKSLLYRMGYIKRKCSNAGKMSVYQFKELQGVFLADIQAEIAMNDIPNEMIFNWDQTALQFVPIGLWTMHHAGEKVIPIADSDDKRQVTAVIAATLTDELLPPQINYKGKTERCHPKRTIPKDQDIWHNDNHWSAEDNIKRYVEKIIVPFLNEKRTALKLNRSHPALAIFDYFHGQTTPDFYSPLKQYNIIPILIPANCTDKLQSLDVSLNKPLKDEVKKRFQAWYANEIQEQLKTVPVYEVKVDVTTGIIKAKNFGCMVYFCFGNHLS